jgi:hypothetical protein
LARQSADSTAQYSAVQYSTVQYSTLQCSAVHYLVRVITAVLNSGMVWRPRRKPIAGQ